MFVRNANSDPPPYIDTLGDHKIRFAWFRDALLDRLRRSGSAALLQEAEKIASCACLLDVHKVAELGIVARKACGSALCPVCGLRPSTDSFRAVAKGIDWYRLRSVPVFLYTVSLPVVADGDAATAIASAWSLWRKVLVKIRETATIDWHVRIELQVCGNALKAHFHAIVAIVSLGLEGEHPRRPDGKLLVNAPVHPCLASVASESLSQIGKEVLQRTFPETAEALDNDDVANHIVHAEPVDLRRDSPTYVGLYLAKTLRCGLTSNDLLSVPPAALEELLAATKPEHASRCRRLSQSAVNSRFSRKKKPVDRPATHERLRKSPAPRASRAASLSAEVDLFLGRQMPPQQVRLWIEEKGRTLAQALKNDGDPRGEQLYWRILHLDLVMLTIKLGSPPQRWR